MNFNHTMTPHKHLHYAKHEMLAQKFDGGMEQKILKHWRQYEPKRVERLLAQGILRRSLIQMANALLDMQIALEKTERLPPALSRSEAWNRLMRIEEDAEEEAKAWGMTLEEYLNRPY
jgi:hypothetical protein